MHQSAHAPGSGAVAVGRAIYERFAEAIRELSKFGVVGAICYLIDLGAWSYCRVGLEMGWLPSLVISTVVSTTAAFVGNRFWTWRHRQRNGLHREYALYFGFNLVGLVISAALLWISHDGLGHLWPIFQTPLADTVSGKVVGVGLASVFRFWAYRRFVFPATEPEVQTSE